MQWKVVLINMRVIRFTVDIAGDRVFFNERARVNFVCGARKERDLSANLCRAKEIDRD